MSNVPESYKSEDEIGQDLSLFPLQGNWEDVVEIYRRYPWTHTRQRSTATKYTALHVVADCRQEQSIGELAIILTNLKQGELIGCVNEKGIICLDILAHRHSKAVVAFGGGNKSCITLYMYLNWRVKLKTERRKLKGSTQTQRLN